MKRRAVILLLAALALPGRLAAEPESPPGLRLAGGELEPLRTLAIQDGGRTKPLDTFARETGRGVVGANPFGFESVLGLDPLEWIVAMLAAPDRWREVKMVKVTHAGLRQAAGLPPAQALYSLQELSAHPGFLAAAQAVHQKVQKDREAKVDRIERELSTLYETRSIRAGIFSGESLRIIPQPGDASASWFSLADLEGIEAPPVQRIRTLLAALVVAYRDGDRVSVGASAAALKRRLAELAPRASPPPRGPSLPAPSNT